MTRGVLSASMAVTACALVLGAPLPVTAAVDMPRSAAEPRLVTRAVLPADTFAEGPPAGAALGIEPINGRTPPFPTQPLQGVSAVVQTDTRGTYFVLLDNGFGGKANSADFLLRAYHVRPHWERANGGPGTVQVLGFVSFRDPHRSVPWPIIHESTPDRLLTGADFDPESLQVAPDGTLWLGDEFGPFLLHFSADGALLEPPVSIPVPRRLRAYAKGLRDVRSPDHPALADLPPAEARAAANLPRSRGIEGLALSIDGHTLYPSLEGALVDDPNQNRRVVYVFDPRSGRFSGPSVDYMMDQPSHAIGDLAAAARGTLLIIERDKEQGAAARAKRVYEVDIARPRGLVAPKALLADLLRIANPFGIGGPPTPDTVGLGDPFAFPFQTIESLLVQDRRTVLLINDNNYPFSSARRRGTPDDTEFIKIRLNRCLPTAHSSPAKRPTEPTVDAVCNCGCNQGNNGARGHGHASLGVSRTLWASTGSRE